MHAFVRYKERFYEFFIKVSSDVSEMSNYIVFVVKLIDKTNHYVGY